MSEFLYLVIISILLTIIFLKKEKTEKKELLEPLQKKCQQLEEEVKYYKNLCLWHVEDKEKLKKEKINK